jgi:hypothetical protein
MEKAPNINPMYNPLAPRSRAYTGSSGTTIPAPVTVVNIEKKRVLKIFLFSFSTPDVPFKAECILGQGCFEEKTLAE